MSSNPQKATLKPNLPLVLASSSPRRKELLGQLIVNFETFTPDVNELKRHANGPDCMVAENALLKALCASSRFPRNWILAADTTVALKSEALGKPKDLEEARSMLARLSDQTHEVHTGVCLISADRKFQKCQTETSKVTFKRLSQSMIEEYLSVVNPLDKAGAYALQTRSEWIVDSLEGSASNVIGLPVELIQKWFIEVGLLCNKTI